MPKIKIPKSSPSIDMTPMVDLAFLLVTFFMLTASFRSNEPVTVDTPSSVSDKEVPEKSTILITVDNGGFAYYNALPPEGGAPDMRKNILLRMCEKYKVQLTEKQIEAFEKMSSFGCSMAELPRYLDLSPQERQSFSKNPGFKGIPSDTLHGANEMKDWINFGNAESLAAGGVAYEDAVAINPDAVANDFKPKFILKVDGKAEYAHAKKIIEIFRDLNLNNLNFVTSLEAGPEQKMK